MKQGQNVTTTMKRTAHPTVPGNDPGWQVHHRIYLQQHHQQQQQQQQQQQHQHQQQSQQQRPFFDYEFWKNPDELTELHFLMPNGVMITMCIPIQITLEELKTVRKTYALVHRLTYC
uniref:Uncharacterized protein n=1 Tax=Anopheles maculatus TaxID=74869 RepID=A0A182T0T7_9DIPT